jgi:hypothetical protein
MLEILQILVLFLEIYMNYLLPVLALTFGVDHLAVAMKVTISIALLLPKWSGSCRGCVSKIKGRAPDSGRHIKSAGGLMKICPLIFPP